jgi:hypothetical protein
VTVPSDSHLVAHPNGALDSRPTALGVGMCRIGQLPGMVRMPGGRPGMVDGPDLPNWFIVARPWEVRGSQIRPNLEVTDAYAVVSFLQNRSNPGFIDALCASIAIGTFYEVYDTIDHRGAERVLDLVMSYFVPQVDATPKNSDLPAARRRGYGSPFDTAVGAASIIGTLASVAGAAYSRAQYRAIAQAARPDYAEFDDTWLTVPLADVVERVLKEEGRSMSPGDIYEELQGIRRSISRDDIQRALSNLKKQKRIQRRGGVYGIRDS